MVEKVCAYGCAPGDCIVASSVRSQLNATSYPGRKNLEAIIQTSENAISSGECIRPKLAKSAIGAARRFLVKQP